jgi:two-component system, sensor histidine kinase and response regulator
MPVMDGFEATKRIIQMLGGQDRAPPIIALTAYTTEETRKQCLHVGMRGFLTKPLEMNKFKEILSSLGLQ